MVGFVLDWRMAREQFLATRSFKQRDYSIESLCKATGSHQWLIYAVQTGIATSGFPHHINVDKRRPLHPGRNDR